MKDCEGTVTFDGGEVVFARFAPEGDALLAGVALTAKGRTAWRAFPAERRDESCWRVDDGCVFEAENYRVAFVLRRGTELWLLGRWFGAESENIELLRLDGDRLRPEVEGSRYTSPL